MEVSIIFTAASYLECRGRRGAPWRVELICIAGTDTHDLESRLVVTEPVVVGCKFSRRQCGV
jgi:hypothetical protein